MLEQFYLQNTEMLEESLEMSFQLVMIIIIVDSRWYFISKTELIGEK